MEVTLIALILISYLVYLLHFKIIPSLQRLDKRVFKNKNRPKLSPNQESEIKGYMRQILATTSFNRVSLYFLDSPYINNNLIQADSYTLWIEASKSIPMRKDTKLSFAYISEEFNRMIQAKITHKYYKNATEGLICQVWLRDRHTVSYGIYIINDCSFLLLEIAITQLPKLFYILLRHNKHGDYVSPCSAVARVLR